MLGKYLRMAAVAIMIVCGSVCSVAQEGGEEFWDAPATHFLVGAGRWAYAYDGVGVASTRLLKQSLGNMSASSA